MLNLCVTKESIHGSESLTPMGIPTILNAGISLHTGGGTSTSALCYGGNTPSAPPYQSTINENSSLEVGFVVDVSYLELENDQRKVLLMIQCQMNKLKKQCSQITLNIQKSDGPKLTLLDLPYSMDDSSETK